jgi:hypothetical protein
MNLDVPRMDSHGVFHETHLEADYEGLVEEECGQAAAYGCHGNERAPYVPVDVPEGYLEFNSHPMPPSPYPL